MATRLELCNIDLLIFLEIPLVLKLIEHIFSSCKSCNIYLTLRTRNLPSPHEA